MPTALLLSPHLDDVAFSCGGLAATLADQGWRVVMATAFTASVPRPTGFALACQLDKGLSPDIDYMALRRAEDTRAASLLGIEARFWPLPEAPHRGYHSAAALFGPPHGTDTAAADLIPHIQAALAELAPALVAAPQGLGGHVDHRALLQAVIAAVPERLRVWYRDTPYAIRDPHAEPDPAIADLPEHTVPIGPALARKIDAACAYGSQIGFQFGGPDATRRALHNFAMAEGQGVPAERLRVADVNTLVPV